MYYRSGKAEQLNSINFNLYKVIMAIPFFGNSEAEEEEPRVDSVQEVFSESDGERDMLENEPSFVGRLLQELVGVYSRMSNNSGPRSAGRRRIVRNNTRINDLPPTRQNTTPTLPDLLSSHAQDLHPISPQNDATARETLPRPSNNRPRNNRGPRRPPTQSSLFGPASTDDDLNSELALDVKMNIDFCYKRIGRDLRQISDRFENTNCQCPQRRRHPAENHSTNTEIKFKSELAIKFAIPVALIGLSLAFLRKSP